MPLTRRAIVRYGLPGAVLLALVGTTACHEPTARAGGAVLSARHTAIVEALAAHIVPTYATFPDPTTLDLIAEVDAFLARSPAGLQTEFLQLLDLLDSPIAGLLFDGRPSSFRTASPAARDATLERWRTSRLAVRRMGFRALQTLCGALYYSHPQVRAAIGYAGPTPLDTNAAMTADPERLHP